jgi:hypothetical protein
VEPIGVTFTYHRVPCVEYTRCYGGVTRSAADADWSWLGAPGYRVAAPGVGAGGLQRGGRERQQLVVREPRLPPRLLRRHVTLEARQVLQHQQSEASHSWRTRSAYQLSIYSSVACAPRAGGTREGWS